MPRRLATSWATLTQAARRAHGTAQEDAAAAAEQPFDCVDVDDVDVDKQEEQEPVQDPYPGQEPPPELDEALPPPQQAPQQPLPPPLWPDQLVAANSFESWRNEQASRQVRLGYEAAGDAVEAAIIQASILTAERDERCRAFMAAERAAYEQLNAQAEEPTQQQLIAQAEDLADAASRLRAEREAHEELNQMRRAGRARRAEPDAAERDAMRRAASQLRQERRVRSRLAKAAHDDEAGPSGGI